MAIRQPRSRNLSFYNRIVSQVNSSVNQTLDYQDRLFELQYNQGQISFEKYAENLYAGLNRYSEGSLERQQRQAKINTVTDSYEDKLVSEALATGVNTRDVISFYQKRASRYEPGSARALEVSGKIRQLNIRANREDESTEELRIKNGILLGNYSTTDLFYFKMQKYEEAQRTGNEDEHDLLGREKELMDLQFKIRDEGLQSQRESLRDARAAASDRREMVNDYIADLKDSWAQVKNASSEYADFNSFGMSLATLNDFITNLEDTGEPKIDNAIKTILNESRTIYRGLSNKVVGVALGLGRIPGNEDEWFEVLQYVPGSDGERDQMLEIIKSAVPEKKWGALPTAADFDSYKVNAGKGDAASLTHQRNSILSNLAQGSKSYFIADADGYDFQFGMSDKDVKLIDSKLGIYQVGKKKYIATAVDYETGDVQGTIQAIGLVPVEDAQIDQDGKKVDAFKVMYPNNPEGYLVTKDEALASGFGGAITSRYGVKAANLVDKEAQTLNETVGRTITSNASTVGAAIKGAVWGVGLAGAGAKALTRSIIPVGSAVKALFASTPDMSTPGKALEVAKAIGSSLKTIASDARTLRVDIPTIVKNQAQAIQSALRGERGLFPEVEKFSKAAKVATVANRAIGAVDTALTVGQVITGKQFRSEAERNAQPPEQQSMASELMKVFTPLTYAAGMGPVGFIAAAGLSTLKGAIRVGELQIRTAELEGKGQMIEQLKNPAYAGARFILQQQGLTPDVLASDRFTNQQASDRLNAAIKTYGELKTAAQNKKAQGEALSPVDEKILQIAEQRKAAVPPPPTPAAPAPAQPGFVGPVKPGTPPPAPVAPAGNRVGKVTGVGSSNLNVRSSANGSVVGKVREGEQLTILGQEGDWLKTDKGYVSARFVSIQGSAPAPAPAPAAPRPQNTSLPKTPTPPPAPKLINSVKSAATNLYQQQIAPRFNTIKNFFSGLFR